MSMLSIGQGEYVAELQQEIRDLKKFWSWLLLSASGENVYWSDTSLMGWLQAKEAEYQSLHRKS